MSFSLLPFYFEEVLMGLGALLWIVGELWAVRKGEDTTTSYVRRGMKKGKGGLVARAAVFLFVTWLWQHFMIGWF